MRHLGAYRWRGTAARAVVLVAAAAAGLAASAQARPAAEPTAAAAPTPASLPMFAEPTLSPDGATIAFVSGGDIWEVPAAGGVAHLLVTDAATEGRPLYSPDGRRLAFTSTRGGSANIFVLDLAGGKVTRLTYAEATEELDAWTPDGRAILFASAAADVGRQTDIFRISANGGTPVAISRERYLSEFQAAPSPDGGSIALMMRGISNAQWWRNGHSHIDETELWVRPATGAGGWRRLLDDGAKNAWPIWSADGTALTFMSDSGGAENLWRMSAAGGAPQQLTRFADGRLLFPSGNAHGVVFERDMGIWRYDPATGGAAPVSITLRGAPASEPPRHRSLTSFDRMALAPDGQKLALITHGELYAVGAKDGGTAQRVTTSLGAERDVLWTPDSRRLVYVSERGLDHRLAEYDFATGSERLLTASGIAQTPAIAPDGKSIAYVVNRRELRLHRSATARAPASDSVLFTGAIDTDEDGVHPVWSPDGRWIAFPVRDARSFVNIHVVPVAGGEARAVSFLGNGQMGRIAWSPDGRYILFDTAQRSEPSRIVRIDLLPHVPKFREDLFRDLFKAAPPGTPGETAPAPDRPARTAAPVATRAKPAAAPPPPTVRIVWDGLAERATVVPLGLSAQDPMIAADGKTLVFRAHEQNRDNFYRYSLDEQATEPPSAEQISATDKRKGDAALSGDGKTLAYLEGGKVMVAAVAEGKPKPLTASAEFDVDFDAEKRVVFDEAWATLDVKFFDPGFTGHDWRALRKRFEPYALGAHNADELRRVINLMIGELNASHSGINRPPRGDGALPVDRVGNLGLRFDSPEAGGTGLVVSELVPLGPGAVEGGIRVGDRLIGIDGTTIGAGVNVDAALENKVGQRVTLHLATAAGRRDAVVRPFSATVAAGLRYRAWVADRRRLVERLSQGRLGYVHMLDMSSDSLDQLYLDLDAPNQSRQGVVIDVRNNNGGFVNGYALDVFSRRNFLTMTPRGLFSVPSRQALGQRALGLPTVLVTNESSLSDAEDFAEGYRSLGLGKIVGQPTAGWIIYTGQEELLDGSVLRVPQTRIQDAAGRDMEMHPRPVDIAARREPGEEGDAQLAAAVATLLGSLPPAMP